MELSGSCNNPANRPMRMTPTVHPWYQGGYRQQTVLETAPNLYCPQNEQQMWYQHPMQTHSVFPLGVPDYMYQSRLPMLQTQLQNQHQTNPRNNFPSPPLTGSESGTPSPGPINNTPLHIHDRLPDGSRLKGGYRMVYTEHQRNELEKEFLANNKYISVRKKHDLASSLGLSEKQIKVWFQNRRAKERKNRKRLEETIETGVSSHQNNFPQMPMFPPSEFHVPFVGCNPTVSLQTNQDIQ